MTRSPIAFRVAARPLTVAGGNRCHAVQSPPRETNLWRRATRSVRPFARLCFAGLIVSAACHLVHVRTACAVDAVESGREGLVKSESFPWYNDQADALHPIDFQPTTPPREIRNWNWDVPERRPANNFGLGNFWSSFWDVFQIVIWVVLAILVAVAIYYGVRTATLRERSLATNVTSTDDIAAQAKRIENLPFQVEKPLSDLLAEARRLYDSGQYGDAIVYLFSHQLVQLDKHHMIRLAKGKTNRQYLRELRSSRGMRDLLSQTMVTFEDFFFGNHAIDRQRFESCWSRLQEFDTSLEQSGVATS